MTPQDLLLDLLDRLAALQGKPVLISQDELASWAALASRALIDQKIITKAGAAKSAICPGCEEACVMPVEMQRKSTGDSSLFVLCDKRSDINRVGIGSNQLVQWQFNLSTLAEFVATDLGIQYRGEPLDDGLQIGMARGKKRRQLLGLFTSPEVTIVAGTASRLAADVIVFEGDAYHVDNAITAEIVDQSSTGDERYTPNTARKEVRKLETASMYDDWQKVYRKLQQTKPNMGDTWYSQRIAKMDIACGRSAETIRRKMKR